MPIDRASLHVSLADEAAHIGPAPSAASYLNIDRILDAARRHNAEAIQSPSGSSAPCGKLISAQ